MICTGNPTSLSISYTGIVYTMFTENVFFHQITSVKICPVNGTNMSERGIGDERRKKEPQGKEKETYPEEDHSDGIDFGLAGGRGTVRVEFTEGTVYGEL